MANSETNPKVGFYFDKAEKWQPEIEKLRTIVLGCGLAEELKWGCPCYTFENRNIVIIHVFKDYCALLFFKGALLKDPENILVQQTKNVQSARQIRFTGIGEIIKLEQVLKAYIYEAAEVEKAGLKVNFKEAAQFEMPQELEDKLTENADFKTAFEALSPGRQKGYLLYFSSAKQPFTREARIEKYRPQILDGKGLND